MKYIKYIIIIFILLLIPVSVAANEEKSSLQYQTHIQNTGWEKNYKNNGQISGTTGRSLKVEAIKINLQNQEYFGTIEYQTHIQNIGWESSFKKSNEISGTTGKSLGLEAIRIYLTGEMSINYDIYYRVHVGNIGWLDWAKNGETAGTEGYSKQIEAIQIELVKKGENSPGRTTMPSLKRTLGYKTHIQNIGWEKTYKNNNEISGTVGRSLQLESIQINLLNQEYSGNIEYKTHIQNIGWETEFKKNGEISGTTGKSLRLEAIKIQLTGEMAEHYDIYYRVHVGNIGWLSWAKNGSPAGTEGYAYQLEAIQIMLIKKGHDAPEDTQKPFIKKYISYNTHSSNFGWNNNTEDGKESGKIRNALESYIVELIDTTYEGRVLYSSYVRDDGWQDEVSNGNISGTTGKSKPLEAVKIRLDGNIAQHYDIAYQVYISGIGWLDWAYNGEITGNIGYNNQIEAIKIELRDKLENTIEDNRNIYAEEELRINYQSYVKNSGWHNEVNNGSVSGTTGMSSKLLQLRIKLNKKVIKGIVSYSIYDSKTGWSDYKSEGNTIGDIKSTMEAIKIKLDGDISNYYDIYYRTHVSNVGWLDWTMNDNPSGTIREGLSIEAIQIQLVEKGGTPPGETAVPFREAKWVTVDGNSYFYNIYNQKVTGDYKIGDKMYYFGPTGIYLGTNQLRVIDVSSWQGNIDWNAVAGSGIYGVILRIGWLNTEDPMFETYISEVKRLNIPYGLYIFSYATDQGDVNKEADFTKSMINKYNLNPTLGIYYDLEQWDTSDGYHDTMNDKDDFERWITSYSSQVRSSYNYDVKIYASTNYIETRFNDATKQYVGWVAEWGSSCSYTGKYNMWQFTSNARVNGISGDVDMNILYK